MGRYDGIDEFDPDLTGQGLRIGIAMSRFTATSARACSAAARRRLKRLGVRAADMQIVTAPGALELPLVLQTMAQGGRFDALVALGCVIRGETYHFEIVSNESARGITDVQLATGVPVANGVLTTEDDDQALARMVQKGREAGQGAVEMANLQKFIRK
ncbi:MAG: 6,7-dimethyl-8-ribityllumazine synthase [Betaproteobacteria bacterium]|nr:6,7-dimethyl-8-ribityllumazine synthase [Betaproteobacteria bacterium]